jgi:hypothetical protein
MSLSERGKEGWEATCRIRTARKWAEACPDVYDGRARKRLDLLFSYSSEDLDSDNDEDLDPASVALVVVAVSADGVACVVTGADEGNSDVPTRVWHTTR